ncbi:sigma-70 family RNA polymerase sigma factor [Streptomyces vinaceus]|uniref:sigma-70 family RNA polymerase sigma factor n=1 Tax=Streptomyces vinaceus TaxID=1960 RepID=UPI0036B27EBF
MRQELIILHLPLVVRAARRHCRSPRTDFEELRQTGTIGLIKAVDRFDPKRRTPFPPFALVYINGEIKRYFRDSGWAVHIPRNMKDKAVTVTRAARQLTSSLGRTPTPEDIASHLNLDISDVTEALLAANGWQARPLASTELKPTADFRYLDTHTERELQRIEDCQTVSRMLQSLSSSERRIMELRFRHRLTQREIGLALGIGQPQVSRLISENIRKLRNQIFDDVRLDLK